MNSSLSKSKSKERQGRAYDLPVAKAGNNDKVVIEKQVTYLEEKMKQFQVDLGSNKEN